MLTDEERSDYGTLVGLWRNLDRVLFRQAAAMAMGFIAAASGEQLTREWFDALAEYESQVEDLAYTVNFERLKNAMRAKYSSRGGS